MASRNTANSRNPLAAPNRRVNVPKVEPDKTKYKRKDKHKKGADNEGR